MISHVDVQHRDCFDSLAAMRDAGGARLIVTSPPYPDARTVEQYGGAEFDTSLAGYGRLGEAVFEALMPGGVCALNIDGPIRVWRPELGETERSLIAFEVAIDWAKRIGFRYVEHCAYVRDAQPISQGDRWRSGWEPLHVFARTGGETYFDRDGDTRPALTAGKTELAGGGRGKGVIRSTRRLTHNERRSLTTAERFPPQTNTDHCAPFSRLLAAAYVLCYSAPGDLVGDPFVGSGTVAIVANTHGRRFIGGDLGHRERDGRRWADIVRDGCSQRTLDFNSDEHANDVAPTAAQLSMI
jgi:hypothetical protein